MHQLRILLFLLLEALAQTEARSDELPPELERMLVAAECTYRLTGITDNSGNDQSRIQKCLSNNLDEEKTPTYISSYISPSRLGVDAFYWSRAKTGDVILAFRGTLPIPKTDPHSNDLIYGYILNLSLWQSLADWANDFKFKNPIGGVHPGFLESWEELKRHLYHTGPDYQKQTPEETLNQIKTALEHGSKLYIVGHSKGGSLAALAARHFVLEAENELRLEPNQVTVYTFESPLTFDQGEAKRYDATGIQHYRLEYKDDIIPHLPPPKGFLKTLGSTVANLAINETNYLPVGKLIWQDDHDNIRTSDQRNSDHLYEDKANQFAVPAKWELMIRIMAGSFKPADLITPELGSAFEHHSLCNSWLLKFNKKDLCATDLKPSQVDTPAFKQSYAVDDPAGQGSKTNKTRHDNLHGTSKISGDKINIISALAIIAFACISQLFYIARSKPEERDNFAIVFRQSLNLISLWALCIIFTYSSFYVADNDKLSLKGLKPELKSIGEAVDLMSCSFLFMAAWILSSKMPLKKHLALYALYISLAAAAVWLVFAILSSLSPQPLYRIYLATPGAVLNTLAFFSLAGSCIHASGCFIRSGYINTTPSNLPRSGIEPPLSDWHTASKYLVVVAPACFFYAWIQVPSYMNVFVEIEGGISVIEGLKTNLFMGKIFIGISLLIVPLLEKLAKRIGHDKWLEFGILLLATLIQIISFARNIAPAQIIKEAARHIPGGG